MDPIRNDFIYGDLKKSVHFDSIPNDSFFRTRKGGGLTLWKKENGKVFDEDNEPADEIVSQQDYECVPLLVIDGAGDSVTFDIPEEYKYELKEYTVYMDETETENTYNFDSLEEDDYFIIFETVFKKISATTIQDVSNNSVRELSENPVFGSIVKNSDVIKLKMCSESPLSFEVWDSEEGDDYDEYI